MARLLLLKAMLAALLLAAAPVISAAQEAPDTSETISQLDINKADAAAIAAALDGVGLVKARDIVAYREMFGSFQAVEELLEVKGIGTATVERNRHRILIVAQ
ncbi:MAG: ComEA family DNA-binding protein [Pseudohongiellaceae bacterium]|jgi:competence protein ComEA